MRTALDKQRYGYEHEVNKEKVVELVKRGKVAICCCCGRETPLRKFRYQQGRRTINETWIEAHHLTYSKLLAVFLPVWLRYVPLCSICHRGAYGDWKTNDMAMSGVRFSVAHHPKNWIEGRKPSRSRNTVLSACCLLLKFGIVSALVRFANWRDER